MKGIEFEIDDIPMILMFIWVIMAIAGGITLVIDMLRQIL